MTTSKAIHFGTHKLIKN